MTVASCFSGPPETRGISDKFQFHRCGDEPGVVGAVEKFAHALFAARPIIEREVVDVHADELVGQLGVETAPERQGVLDAGGFDPTVINGGIINAYGTNARLGAGEWMVVEADESDGTFVKLPADIAIVTNIDAEHLDYFKSFEAVEQAFRAFVENVPFYGFSVLCADHPVVQKLIGRIEDRRIVSYGENPQADVRLLDVDLTGGITRFAVLIRQRATGRATYIDDLALPMPGRHNALNATAAIAVAHELGLSDDTIRKALAGFGGVRRRFTKTGE